MKPIRLLQQKPMLYFTFLGYFVYLRQNRSIGAGFRISNFKNDCSINGIWLSIFVSKSDNLTEEKTCHSERSRGIYAFRPHLQWNRCQDPSIRYAHSGWQLLPWFLCCTSWLKPISTKWKNPAACIAAGDSAKGFGKKRGRKEDLRRERMRLTASATFLLLGYFLVLNIE